MKTLCVLAVVACVGGCISDQQWEGPINRCSGNNQPDVHAIMLLDGPVGPNVSGYMGYSVTDNNDTFVMGAFKDGTNLAGTMKFEAVFDTGNSTTRWQVELKHGPLGGDYEGTVEANSGNSTTRCDVKLSAVH